MSRCNKKGFPNDMPINKVKDILNGLFLIGRKPVQRKVEERDREDIAYNTTLDEEDVKSITAKINEKKAVGIDGVPGDIVKLLVNNRTEVITKVINSIAESGRIPRCWKTGKVILLSKPGKDPKLPNSYRPISILPALSKVWEKCLKEIIERCMGVDPFHRRQYGFRKRRSTVDAITQVIKFADTCKKKRVICLMIALDIKNAFKTLSWDSIIEEMTRRRLLWKIIRVINNYLTDRRIIASNQFGTVEYQVAAGVPQGSVLWPFLWNMVYDRLLERLDNRVLFRVIAFADDLAITCAVKKNEGVSGIIEEIMRTVSDWCASVGLTLAKEKTEVILITGYEGAQGY